MALEAKVGKEGVDRVVLEETPWGVYVFVFEHSESIYPYKDYLQDTWEMAKQFCQEDLNVGNVEWVEIADPNQYDS